jgi:hypothetical protein
MAVDMKGETEPPRPYQKLPRDLALESDTSAT